MERDSLLGLISILKCLGSFGLFLFSHYKNKYHGQLYNKTEEYKLISKSHFPLLVLPKVFTFVSGSKDLLTK